MDVPQRAMVTGAEGFIGSHLVERLVAQGYAVRALVYYNAFGHRGWLEGLPADVLDHVDVVVGDVRDPAAMRGAIRGCDQVFHLAALIGIPFSYSAPDSYIDTNVRGTLNVLQAAREFQVERVIHTSTSEVYGTAQYVPIDEAHPVVGQSPYSASKIGADQLAISFHRSFDTPVAIMRPFNTYGPRQSLRAVIPTIIRQIAGGARSIQLGAVTPTRDFSFVTDTAAGFIALARSEQAIGEVVNLGAGFEVSVGDTARIIAEEMGVDVCVELDSKRLRPGHSEVERLLSDNSKMRRLTGWSPSYAGLDGFRRGIAETAAWFGRPENLSRYPDHGYVV